MGPAYGQCVSFMEGEEKCAAEYQVSFGPDAGIAFNFYSIEFNSSTLSDEQLVSGQHPSRYYIFSFFNFAVYLVDASGNKLLRQSAMYSCGLQ